jgi:hypothetical protein
MPKKKLGHRNVLKLDGVVIACIRKFTPPEKSREEVDVTCLGDAIQDHLDADPQQAGMLKFELVWEPGDTNSQLLDTLIDAADVDDRDGVFTIEWKAFVAPTATTGWKVDTFTGRILKLTPAEVESKTVISRTVEVRLTTPVVRTTAA